MVDIVVEDGTLVSGANSYITIAELQEYANLRGATIADDIIDGPVPTTSYSNADGMGDRQASITVTSNMTALSGAFTNIVNGNTANNATHAVELPSTVNSGDYILFDFGPGEHVYINEITIYGSDGADLEHWKVEASQDQTTWVELDDSMHLFMDSSGLSNPLTTTAASTYGYRYYRISKITASVALGTGVFFSEINFKIAEGSDRIDAGTATKLIIQAMDYLEQQPFKGIKVRHTQALQWPRANVYIDSYLVDSDEIPQLLKDAQCEIAISINAGNGPLDVLDRTQKRVKVGDLEVEYESGRSESLPRAMYNKLAKLLGGGTGGSNFLVKRG